MEYVFIVLCAGYIIRWFIKRDMDKKLDKFVRDFQYKKEDKK